MVFVWSPTVGQDVCPNVRLYLFLLQLFHFLKREPLLGLKKLIKIKTAEILSLMFRKIVIRDIRTLKAFEQHTFIVVLLNCAFGEFISLKMYC